jgi:hypothetical protein
MKVRNIIEQSSNVGTIKIGLDLGGKRLDEYVRKFGFGTTTGLDFPGESKGIVLDRSDWSGSTIATIPIGQGIAVTPMQMAAAYAAIANGGVWTEPKLLYAIQGPEGKIRRSPEASRRRLVSRRTARRVSRILQRAVSQGTGIEAQIPGRPVALAKPWAMIAPCFSSRTVTARMTRGRAAWNRAIGSFIPNRCVTPWACNALATTSATVAVISVLRLASCVICN